MEITEHYPKDFQEFLSQFKTDDDCWDYIFWIKWPNGFVYPNCNSSKYWLTKDKTIHCSICQNETSVTSGTIFHKTRKPLLLWVHIMWWVVAQKTGASANNLKDFRGFGSYETAWAWLHKLRRAMTRPLRDKLTGQVEVDETYIGGIEKGNENKGRGAKTKVLVVVETECIGKQIGRVRFRIIDEASTENLSSFIEENIQESSTVITDEWTGYSYLVNSSKYKYEKKVIFGSGKQAHELLPHVHLVDSLVKRWINGTHQGNISAKHLQYYLDEFAFRFNGKLSTYRGKLFFRLMQQAVETQPITLYDIVK